MKVFDTSGQLLQTVAADAATSNALSVLSQGLSVVSQALSVETANRVSAANALSQAISVVSQAVSVLSQATSVTDAALSVAINVVSNALSNQISIHNVLSNRVSANSGVASVTSQEMSVADAALSVRIDTQSQRVSVISQALSALSQAVSVADAALSVRIDTQSQSISVLSQQVSVLSQAHSVLSQALSALSQATSVADAALSVAINVVSNALSQLQSVHDVLSNRVSANSAVAGSGSVTSNEASAISAQAASAISVISQAVSVLSQALSAARRHPWRVQGLSGLVSGTSTINMAAQVVEFYNPTTFQTTCLVSVAAVTNDVGLSAGVDNGRDTDAVFTSSIWVHVYLVLDGATVKSRTSLTAPPTGPALQGTESAWAYVGAIRRNASNALVATRLRGATMFYENIDAHLALNAGNATVETAIDLTIETPPNAVNTLVHTAGTMADTTQLASYGIRVITGLNFTYGYVAQASTGTTAANAILIVVPNIAQNIYYLWNGTYTGRTLYVRIMGYTVPNGDA